MRTFVSVLVAVSLAFPYFEAAHVFADANSRPQSAFLGVNPVVINEIDYDQVGADVAEFVELKNVGAGPINLDNFAVELVNGNAGGAAVYDTIDLPNVNLAAGDYYVICANTATVINCDLDDGPDTDFMQNGAPDAVGLRNSGVLVDAVSYEGNTGAPYTENTGVPVAAADSNTVAFIGLSRSPDGTDTNNNSVDLSIRCISPGGANFTTTTGCGAPTAANVSISGRVLSANGLGIFKTRVFLSGGNLSEPLIALTNPFGYYRFEGLDAGRTYVLTVQSKRHHFAQPSLTVTPGDDAIGLDFVAEP